MKIQSKLDTVPHIFVGENSAAQEQIDSDTKHNKRHPGAMPGYHTLSEGDSCFFFLDPHQRNFSIDF